MDTLIGTLYPIFSRRARRSQASPEPIPSTHMAPWR